MNHLNTLFSLTHCLTQVLKGRAQWRIISFITMLLLNPVASFLYHSLFVLCGVKLDSFLSPTFFQKTFPKCNHQQPHAGMPPLLSLLQLSIRISLEHILLCQVCCRENVAKVHRQFLAPGSTDCYLGQSNPLNARKMVEPCVLPNLCYSTESWIYDESCLGLLNQFQSNRTKTQCKTLKFPFSLSPSPCLSWPSMTAEIHLLKFGFLCHLLSLEHDTFVCSASSFSIVSSVLLVALVSRPRVSLVFAVSLVVLVLQCSSNPSTGGTQLHPAVQY